MKRKKQIMKFEKAIEPICLAATAKFCSNCFSRLMEYAIALYEEFYIAHKKATGRCEPIYIPKKGDYSIVVPFCPFEKCLKDPGQTFQLVMKILRFYSYIHSKTHSFSILQQLVFNYVDKLCITVSNNLITTDSSLR